MATVCVRVSWTIFQMEDHSLSLSELFENIKSGRVSIIVPSSEIVRESFHRKIQRDPYKYRSKYSTL